MLSNIECARHKQNLTKRKFAAALELLKECPTDSESQVTATDGQKLLFGRSCCTSVVGTWSL